MMPRAVKWETLVAAMDELAEAVPERFWNWTEAAALAAVDAFADWRAGDHPGLAP